MLMQSSGGPGGNAAVRPHHVLHQISHGSHECITSHREAP
jgi:hypothetical protein